MWMSAWRELSFDGEKHAPPVARMAEGQGKESTKGASSMTTAREERGGRGSTRLSCDDQVANRRACLSFLSLGPEELLIESANSLD